VAEPAGGEGRGRRRVAARLTFRETTLHPDRKPSSR
jgi:hypothetical protein